MPGEQKMNRLAVLMTCFNRREMTEAGLRSLRDQVGIEDLDLRIYLTDDASSDGTSEAVRRNFPEVFLLIGDGSLFWNGGMRRAFSAAMEDDFDGYILFNDDTVLEPDAVGRLVACGYAWQRTNDPAIVVGSTLSPETQTRSYGGFRLYRKGLKMELRAIMPDPVNPVRCDSMNGNFVLIPRAVVAVLGNLEAGFRHQIADVDYGLRARAAGIDVVLAPGYLGFCSGNSELGTWKDRSLPFRKRWKNLMSPKGAPVREWLLYTRRHYGWRWPLYAVSPYLKTMVTSLVSKRA